MRVKCLNCEIKSQKQASIKKTVIVAYYLVYSLLILYNTHCVKSLFSHSFMNRVNHFRMIPKLLSLIQCDNYARRFQEHKFVLLVFREQKWRPIKQISDYIRFSIFLSNKIFILNISGTL